VPAKEHWPRHHHENFYWLQEDLLRERQPHSAWTFTVLRPQAVFGYAIGSPMNIIAAIGAYAVVQRALGQALCFPGGGRYVSAASDSRMIARAAEFAATHEIAANETYNVVNGDLLVWEDIWASIGKRFDMKIGAAQPCELAKVMPAQESIWQKIVSEHKLQPLSLEQMIGSSWQFADRTLAFGSVNPADSVLSTIKLRKHGFGDCEDTEESIHYWLERMQMERLLPR
jgi:nucleoside-diphosphate-sugar epimerase